MGDRVDALMGECFAELSAGFAAGVAAADKQASLASLVPVSTVRERAFRVRSIRYIATAVPHLERVDPTVEGAYVFTRRFPLDLGLVAADAESAVRAVREEAQAARRAERDAALHAVVEGATPRAYSVAALGALVDGAAGTVRLIAGRDVAKEVKDAGIAVESVSTPPSLHLPGVRALALALTAGPSVQRVTDDLALSWERTGAGSVDLMAVSKFYVDHADRMTAFTH